MAFHISTHDLPCLRSYIQAKSRYDGTTPIRGTTVRPLGGRRKQHRHIEQAPRNHNGAAGIACVLYNTPCVTYYEDGSIHLQHGGYITQSTTKFIARVAPVSGVYMDSQRYCLVVRVAGGEYQCGDEGLWLKYDEATTGYKPVDPVPFDVAWVNRAAMREVKRQYKPFMTYAVGIGKLTEWAKPGLEPGETTSATTNALLLAMRSEDIDDWAWAYPRLLHRAGTTTAGYNHLNQSWCPTFVCTGKRLNDELTRMIKAERGGEVLTVEVLPLGVHKKDPNAKYRRAR